ncbi:hypothetical protein HLRTI_002039 [Halorhabdus tiamatea SARL4B]|uniref:Uncharacterized protein n=1 Tax=Halorhabdus tiamatea SARL4B TaxID=1033806 RepID=U2DIZ2_9EURY|nr:hypothetical protein HLRTI_002039 [Halorhabdus tiamatea SARL4B]
MDLVDWLVIDGRHQKTDPKRIRYVRHESLRRASVWEPEAGDRLQETEQESPRDAAVGGQRAFGRDPSYAHCRQLMT